MVSASCPSCGKDFDTIHAMKIHHKKKHDESIATGNDRDGLFSDDE